MQNYSIQLSESQDLAFRYIAADPNEWISNAVHVRVSSAIDEIVKLAVEKYLEIGLQMPSSRDEIIFDAYERGWIRTAEERNLGIGLPSS